MSGNKFDRGRYWAMWVKAKGRSVDDACTFGISHAHFHAPPAKRGRRQLSAGWFAHVHLPDPIILCHASSARTQKYHGRHQEQLERYLHAVQVMVCTV